MIPLQTDLQMNEYKFVPQTLLFSSPPEMCVADTTVSFIDGSDVTLLSRSVAIQCYITNYDISDNSLCSLSLDVVVLIACVVIFNCNLRVNN